MAAIQQVSDLSSFNHYRESGGNCCTKKKKIKSLQLHKKSYDLQHYSVSKDVPGLETKDVKGAEKPQVKCRYILTFVGFLVSFVNGGIRINTSVNIVAMVNQSAIVQWSKAKSDSCLPLLSNSTHIENTRVNREDGEFVWSPEVQGYILGSYFLGVVIVLIPAGILVERFGSKWLLFTTTLITSVATLLFPTFSWIGVPAVVVLQLLRGVSQGFMQPALVVLVANWFTRRERGLLYTIIHSGLPLGLCLGSLLSGFQCDSFGRWPSSFYTAGAMGVLVSLLVLFLVYENVDVHPRISKSERDFILSNQETTLSKRRPNPPWCKMLTSIPVYALMLASFGQLWSVSQFLIVHSTFLGTVLHFPIAENGFITALTFLLQFIAALISGALSSLMIKKNFSLDFTRKFWNLAGCFGFSACLLGIYFARCDRLPSVIFAILSAGVTGFSYAGCNLASADMSPTFAGTLKGIYLSFGSMSSVLLPLVVGYLTDEMQTIEQWNKVFFISIGVVMSTGIIFTFFGSADVQPWNDVHEINSEKVNEKETKY